MAESQLLMYQHNDSNDKKKDQKLLSRNFLDKKLYQNAPEYLKRNHNKSFQRKSIDHRRNESIHFKLKKEINNQQSSAYSEQRSFSTVVNLDRSESQQKKLSKQIDFILNNRKNQRQTPSRWLSISYKENAIQRPVTSIVNPQNSTVLNKSQDRQSYFDTQNCSTNFGKDFQKFRNINQNVGVPLGKQLHNLLKEKEGQKQVQDFLNKNQISEENMKKQKKDNSKNQIQIESKYKHVKYQSYGNILFKQNSNYQTLDLASSNSEKLYKKQQIIKSKMKEDNQQSYQTFYTSNGEITTQNAADQNEHDSQVRSKDLKINSSNMANFANQKAKLNSYRIQDISINTFNNLAKSDIKDNALASSKEKKVSFIQEQIPLRKYIGKIDKSKQDASKIQKEKEQSISLQEFVKILKNEKENKIIFDKQSQKLRLHKKAKEQEYDENEDINNNIILNQINFDESINQIDLNNGSNLIQEKTKWTDIIHPKFSTYLKYKTNVGYQSFQEAQDTFQMKEFTYQMYEDDDQQNQTQIQDENQMIVQDAPKFTNRQTQFLMKKQIFQQKPHLIEFANKQALEEEFNQQGDHKSTKKKQEQVNFNKKKKKISYLVWGRPIFGLYERYGSGASNLDECWAFSGPGYYKGALATSHIDYRGNSLQTFSGGQITGSFKKKFNSKTKK